MTVAADVSTRRVLGLAASAFVVLAAEPLYVLVDTAVVGHLGAVPLAGLGVGGSAHGAAAAHRRVRRVRHDQSGRAMVRRRPPRRRGARGSAGILAGGDHRRRRDRPRRVAGPSGDQAARPAAIRTRSTRPSRGSVSPCSACRACCSSSRATAGCAECRRPASPCASCCSPTRCRPRPRRSSSIRCISGSNGSAIANVAAQVVGGGLFLRALHRTSSTVRPQWTVMRSPARTGTRPRAAIRGVPDRVPERRRRRFAHGHSADRRTPDRLAAMGVHRLAAGLVRDRRAVAGRCRAGCER